MAKSRTLNEIRQSKEFQQAVKSRTVDTLGRTDVAVDEIVENLDGHMYDLIFQAVCDEMNDHPAFDSSLYLTEAGLELFEDEWFEFYHENHGRIMHKLLQNLK